MNLFWKSAGAVALLAALSLSQASAAETANPSLAKEVESYLAEAAPEANDTTFKVFWKDGLKLETGNGEFKLHIGGRVFFDSLWMSSDDFAGSETQDTTYFRAVRLEADGTVYKNTFFKIQVDFAGGTVQLKDVYIGLKKLGPVGTFTAGHFKEPFSLDELTSARFTTFMERAAAISAFSPSRNDGLMLNNNFLENNRLLVAVGIFREANDQGQVDQDGGYSFTFRVAAFFLEDEDTHRVVHAGFGLSYRDPNDELVQFRARPDTGRGTRFVDTGEFDADEVLLLNFELAVTYKTFHAQLEFFMADATGGLQEPTFTGWYVEVGWFIVGGRRNYSKDKKTFDRPKIDQNFHAGESGPGAWQIAVRYDTLDLTDSGITGGVQDCFTVGVNWYWNPNTRVMFNVIFVDLSDGAPEGEGNLTIFGMRFQFDF